MRAAPITFLSDYGLRDEFVGVCHAVMLRRCPAARVIDLSHAIPPQDVRTGAEVLRAALPYTPAGVHLAIVDPGVGATGAGARRALALRTAREGRLLVGPDNGLLMPAAELFGGAAAAVEVGRSPERLEPVSATFHGRDVFAPVAAALAAGRELEQVGEPFEPGLLRELERPAAVLGGGALTAHVLRVDVFGNVVLDALAEQLALLGVEPGSRVSIAHRGRSRAARYARAFADVGEGELLIYEDAQRSLAIAVNLGSAAELLSAARDDEILVRPA